MQEKKIVNLDNNLMLKSENIEYNNDTLKNTLDKIIESGSNDNGSWIKYSDGTMICTKKCTANVNFSAAKGALYEGSLKVGSFPQKFASFPYVFATQRAGGEFIIEGFGSGTDMGKWPDLWMYSTTSKTGISCTIDVLAIGKWQ